MRLTHLPVVLAVLFTLACGGATEVQQPPLHGAQGGVITFVGQGPATDAGRIEARLSALGCTSTGVRDWQGDVEISVESCADLVQAGAVALEPGRIALVTEDGERLVLKPPAQVELIEDPVMGTTIEMALRPADASAFEALTAAHIGEVLRVELDGTELMAPVVQEAIGGGRLQITLADTPLDPVWPVLLMYPGPEGLWTVGGVTVDP